MNTSDLHRFLRGLPAFERLGERSLDALASQMREQDYPAGHTLMTQGQCSSAMHVVITGRIETGALSSEYGKPCELAEGSIIGLLSLANIPELENYQCKESVQVATLSRAHFDALYSLSPAAARLIQYMIAVRLAQLLQAKNHALRQTLRTKATPQKSISPLKRWFGA